MLLKRILMGWVIKLQRGESIQLRRSQLYLVEAVEIGVDLRLTMLRREVFREVAIRSPAAATSLNQSVNNRDTD